MITKPKTPPQALELESAVLGAILLEKDALETKSLENITSVKLQQADAFEEWVVGDFPLSSGYEL